MAKDINSKSTDAAGGKGLGDNNSNNNCVDVSKSSGVYSSKFAIKNVKNWGGFLSGCVDLKKMNYEETLYVCLNLISSSVINKDSKVMSRLFRNLHNLRKNCDVKILSSICKKVLGDSISNINNNNNTNINFNTNINNKNVSKLCAESVDVLCKFLDDFAEKQSDENMLIDHTGDGDEDNAQLEGKDHINESNLIECICEVDVFFSLLTLIFILDTKSRSLIEQNLHIADMLIRHVKILNRRTMDHLTAKSYFYYSLAYEATGKLSDIREELMNGCRSATLHRDLNSHAMLLNLLLRYFLHYKLYDQATKLVTKTNFPENLRSNAQMCRYLYYLGRIQAIELEYSDSHTKLLQALRKAPQGGKRAKGFRLAVTKLAIVVELLMGEIPERFHFYQRGQRKSLVPYLHIMQAVRSGDLMLYRQTIEQNEKILLRDNTYCLICRLHHNVLRAGLKKINLAYSRISLSDIAEKLGLGKNSDVESIIGKAVSDGVIEASIDFTHNFLQSKSCDDAYSTSEPAKAFHKRILFCLQIHSDAVKAMDYPDEKEEDKSEEAEARRQRQLEELARAEDDDMNDDMDV